MLWSRFPVKAGQRNKSGCEYYSATDRFIIRFNTSSQDLAHADFKSYYLSPITQSRTELGTANEQWNLPVTPEEKVYYACLESPSTLSSADCKTVYGVVSEEIDGYGSNMALKYQDQIVMDNIYMVKNNFIAGMNNRKVVVNGVDYYKKKDSTRCQQMDIYSTLRWEVKFR